MDAKKKIELCGQLCVVDRHCRDREELSEVLWGRTKIFYRVKICPPLESRGGVHKPFILERKVNQFRDLGFKCLDYD